MERILGTVDGEELARQYAGGMAAARDGGMNHQEQRRMDDDGELDFENRGGWIGEEEEENLVNERRRQRRLERLQQRRNEEGVVVDQDGLNAVNDDTLAHQQHQLEEDDANGTNEEDAPLLADDSNQINTAETEVAGAVSARKSGKKARRRNLEHRRELQRQRHAAAEMGFVGGGGEGEDAARREMEARMALEG